MPKLHMRLSVELDVSENDFRKIVYRASYGNHVGDVDFDHLPLEVKSTIECQQFEVCDWDGCGYVPSPWLEYDMEASGLYEVDERGYRRKGKTE